MNVFGNDDCPDGSVMRLGRGRTRAFSVLFASLILASPTLLRAEEKAGEPEPPAALRAEGAPAPSSPSPSSPPQSAPLPVAQPGATEEAQAGPAEVTLALPEPPEAIARFDAVEPPVELALPEMPEVMLSADMLAPRLELPEPPVVVVRIEPPVAGAVAPLAIDEDRLRAMVDPLRAKFKFRPGEIDTFVAAYQVRDFRPIWLESRGGDVVLSARAEALRAVISRAEEEGLDSQRLLAVLPTVKGAIPAERQAEAEIQTSMAAFLYARDARGGRLEPNRISAMLTPKLALPSAGDVLGRIAGTDAKGVEPVLVSYHPPHQGYRNLRKALAKLREELATPVLTGSIAGAEGAPHPTGQLPPNWMEGGLLAFDAADPRVPSLRLRLGLQASASNIYDGELRKAVIEFQRANNLTPNARITPKTRAALENPKTPLTLADRKPDRDALLDVVLANMERWRWLPADLGALHVFVNVADFNLDLVQTGKVVHQTRVIVGKPQTQTPIFSDQMEHLIVNPSWGVPPSILKKEFLPKLAADPDYARKRGFEVTRRGNSISIRQPPGERNALGHVKFIFPNEHSVYLHDTPTRHLFAQDMRAFSHGCVRVDKPFAFAEKLLASSLGLTETQLRGMVGRGERMIRLTEKIPVHLAYFTVFADEQGALQQRRDLYGHDARLRAALQL